MKIITPVILLSFIFFAAVAANDLKEANLEKDLEKDDYDFDDDDYTSDDNEDIIYSNMISQKKPTTPPPPTILPSSQTLIRSPSQITPPNCKKWRCKMNGYTPNWTQFVSSFCKDNYQKLNIMAKANCQDQFCQKVCEKF